VLNDVDFGYASAQTRTCLQGIEYENPRCEKREKEVSQPTDETVKSPSLESGC
jgi:hypothetical protein